MSTQNNNNNNNISNVNEGNSCNGKQYLEQVIATLRFSKGVVMHFTRKHNLPSRKYGVLDNEQNTNQEETCIIGQSYLAHIYPNRSGCDGVAYEDIGVCVDYKTVFVQSDTDNHSYDKNNNKLQFIDTFRGVTGDVDGHIIRRVDIVNNVLDAAQHHCILQRQSAAFEECERELHILQQSVQL